MRGRGSPKRRRFTTPHYGEALAGTRSVLGRRLQVVNSLPGADNSFITSLFGQDSSDSHVVQQPNLSVNSCLSSHNIQEPEVAKLNSAFVNVPSSADPHVPAI